jgi:hypothetical protein
VDPSLTNFFGDCTDQNDCRLTPQAFWPDYRGVQNWQTFRVTRPGEPAANEASREQAPRRQVWITRLGSYTRVVMLAEAQAEAAPAVSAQSWA